MKDKIKILFVCHGNYCRSPLAEVLFKDMADKAGLADRFYIASAGTSDEDEGSLPSSEIRRLLGLHGLGTGNKTAVQMSRSDYKKYDYIIGMDHHNLKVLHRMLGSDPEGKIHLLLDFSPHPRDIADPWVTWKYDKAYDDIQYGCQCLLQYFQAQF